MGFAELFSSTGIDSFEYRYWFGWILVRSRKLKKLSFRFCRTRLVIPELKTHIPVLKFEYRYSMLRKSSFDRSQIEKCRRVSCNCCNPFILGKPQPFPLTCAQEENTPFSPSHSLLLSHSRSSPTRGDLWKSSLRELWRW